MNSDRVALRVADMSFDAIPQAARQRARERLLDTIGTALGGAATKAARMAAAAMTDPGEASTLIPGAPTRTETAAAFVSAVSASALDYDDGHYLGGAIHPSSVIVPTVLVAASTRPVDLPTFLAAQVAGFEVAVRAAHLLWPRHETNRWFCTGTAGAVGAAAAAAKVRGGDADTIRRAMLIAWAHAPISALQWPTVKEAIGWSAATAVTACRLAEQGWMAIPHETAPALAPTIFPPTPFDEPHAAGDPFVDSLGSTFEIERSYLKPHAACRYTHTAADALNDLLADGLRAHHIHSIRVATHHWATFLTHRRPPSLEHAQYSYPFVLAALAVHGQAGPDQIAEHRLHDPAILDIASRVKVVHDPELDVHLPQHYGTQLDIHLTDGTTMRLEPRLVARGDPADPMSTAEQDDKFAGLVTPLSTVATDRLRQALADGSDTTVFWRAIARAGREQ
ncbi:MmgE/PrpD family protein [Micromonospora sp. HNM0581]|uniref:MmgE/PrpD family protein n=1 Tax=Micromonospora sp. HNM0581 TaxID=2716341 RepID=UPI001469CB68|nr:MmgE/PrpD family protein [Micromonospora sp. HNM0581]